MAVRRWNIRRLRGPRRTKRRHQAPAGDTKSERKKISGDRWVSPAEILVRAIYALRSTVVLTGGLVLLAAENWDDLNGWKAWAFLALLLVSVISWIGVLSECLQRGE